MSQPIDTEVHSSDRGVPTPNRSRGTHGLALRTEDEGYPTTTTEVSIGKQRK